MSFKQKVYDHYLHIISEKIQLLQNTLNDLNESAANETKSTAVDKHETALAMLQIEQANTRAQLKEAQEQKALLEKIDPSLSPVSIVHGSLIKTHKGYLFMSIGLGKAIIDDQLVIAISQQSPLGKQLHGCAVGDRVSVNNNEYLVEAIS